MLFFGKQAENQNELPEPKDEAYWAALFRGQILNVTTQKIFYFVGLADQKAQAMIILNSILVPVAMNWLDKPLFQISASIAIITALTSIFTAILVIYPKRRRGRKPDGTINLLHFGDIGRLNEKNYLSLFKPVFNDLHLLSEESVKDIHDMSRNIVIPKFFWLKLSYGSFFTGNLIAIGWTMYAMWGPAG